MRILVAQAGAPTAVVNRSVAGVVAAAPGETWAAAGPNGLADPTDWRRIGPEDLPADQVRRPGSLIGGGRRAVTEADLDAILAGTSERGIEGLILVGGNGTMALLDAVAERAAQRELPLLCVGVPKTIDNDLAEVAAAPGYPTAANVVRRVVADLSRDHRAMAGVEPVRLIETMGRAVGWLALAATCQRDPRERPDLVLLPENPFVEEEFLESVAGAVQRQGRALVVLSEGVAPQLNTDPVHAGNHTALIRGGVGRRLAELLDARLGLPARTEVLGTLQRAASWAVTDADARSATETGRLAAQWIADRAAHRTMVGGELGNWRPVPLSRVAHRVRPVPQHWAAPGADLTEFHLLLEPLLEQSAYSSGDPHDHLAT